MKSLARFLILVILFVTPAFAVWTDYAIVELGFSKKIVCKNGFLTAILTRQEKDRNVTIEQLVCYDISGWDSSCVHPPIKCEEKSK